MPFAAALLGARMADSMVAVEKVGFGLLVF